MTVGTMPPKKTGDGGAWTDRTMEAGLDVPEDSRSSGIRSLERGLMLLKAMNADPHASVALLGRRVGIPRSSVYRLLATLEQLGYVEQIAGVKGFRLRHTVRSLSEGYRDDDWLEVAWQEMVMLGEAIFWPLCLFTLDGGTMFVRRTTHERSSLSIDYGMSGRRLPMTETAAGRAYLAFCPDAERECLLRQSWPDHDPSETISPDVLDAYLQKARRLGYAERIGGLMARTSSISVPVMQSDRILGCISIIVIRSAFTIERAGVELAPQLIALADRIAQAAAEPLNSNPN